jgi:hypothetical protein
MGHLILGKFPREHLHYSTLPLGNSFLPGTVVLKNQQLVTLSKWNRSRIPARMAECLRSGGNAAGRFGHHREGSDGTGGTGNGISDCQRAFQTGAVRIQIFMKMNFGDAIVIEINGLANGILRNFESAIQIAS